MKILKYLNLTDSKICGLVTSLTVYLYIKFTNKDNKENNNKKNNIKISILAGVIVWYIYENMNINTINSLKSGLSDSLLQNGGKLSLSDEPLLMGLADF